MKIVAAFISDRGDKYLPGCYESYFKHAPTQLIAAETVIDDREHELGMAGACNTAWEWATEQGADYLLHVEEDFRFTAPIELERMVYLLDKHNQLAQLVLKRQPWSSEERAAGGQMETDPEAFTDCIGYVEHRKLFSLNPCLIPSRVFAAIDPRRGEGGAERTITDACRLRGWTFAYYGRRFDPPRCEHVGVDRAGHGWRW